MALKAGDLTAKTNLKKKIESKNIDFQQKLMSILEWFLNFEHFFL